MPELRLTPGGERALREAENTCYALNTAIQGAEHLLAGALLVLLSEDVEGVPAREALERGLVAIHGRGSEELTQKVMAGSSFRMALNETARTTIERGASEIDARTIVRGVIESGEVNPMFYASAGTTREALLELIARG